MLKRNPEERATLSEILQDSELRKALENPLDGMIINYDSGVVCVCVCSVDNNVNKPTIIYPQSHSQTHISMGMRLAIARSHKNG